MKVHKNLSFLIVLAIFAMITTASVYAAEKIQWKGQCWVGSTDLAYVSFQKLAERVNYHP